MNKKDRNYWKITAKKVEFEGNYGTDIMNPFRSPYTRVSGNVEDVYKLHIDEIDAFWSNEGVLHWNFFIPKEDFAEKLHEALNTLTDLQKVIVHHRIWDGLTFTQIAEKYNCTKQNIHQIFNDACFKMRIYLETGEIVKVGWKAKDKRCGPPHEFTCPICEKDISIQGAKAARARWAKQKYCSRECGTENLRRHNKARKLEKKDGNDRKREEEIRENMEE